MAPSLPPNPTRPSSSPPAVVIGWLSLLLCAATPAAAFISEPETLIYGRILNRSGGQSEQLITSGNLRWEILRSDGSKITLTGDVDTLRDGFSYFLRVPHQALVLGQQQNAHSVPLGITKSSASHIEITLDGHPTRILSPATSSLDLEQALRASAYRLDLEVLLPEPDTDGDGIPDWWEDLHGLDKENAADALLDGDGDALNNRGEFLAGSNPNHDNRHPELMTREVIAYAASWSLVMLKTADLDSSPDQLTYTLVGVPTGGRLLLRNPDTTLSAASSFTQAEVNDGRLIFEHTESAEPGTLEVSVRDENPQHPAATGSVRILLFAPSPGIVPRDGAEKLRLYAHHLASTGEHLVADLSATAGSQQSMAPSAKISPANYPAHAASFGEEKPHILLGGPADDVISGGHSDDILSGGLGTDILSGGPGADGFIFTDARDGNDTIVDFSPAENDAIDLSSILKGASTKLTDYLRIQRDGPDAILGVSTQGKATGFADLLIRLKNSPLTDADVPGLYYAGNLITGDATLPPRLSLTASATRASENGPTSSHFTLTREGPPNSALTVGLSFSGTATNGSDFQIVPTSVLMPAGSTSLTLPIIPFADSLYEGDEIVVLSLLPSASYLSGVAMAQLVIEDLKPQLWTEVVESIASLDTLTPAIVMLHRGGAIDRPVTVQLNYAGTAVKDVDYVTPPASLSFAAWDTEKELLITPKLTATFGSAEGKTVNLSVKPSSSYISPTSVDHLFIVPEKITFDDWLASAAPTVTSISSVGHGMSQLMRYGFSLDPRNPAANNARLPKAGLLDGHLTLRFRRNPAISDLIYQVQYSPDFLTWSPAGQAVENISHQVAPNDPGAVIYRATSPMSSSPTGAMRVVIIQPDQP